MISLFIGVIAFFQVQTFDLDYYTTQNGLSNNIIYDIYQDSKGFIWIATENGLNQFDAYEFRVFQHSETDPFSISSNIVRSVTEDDEGNIWLGTSQGINKLDPIRKSFRHFPIPIEFQLENQDIHRLHKYEDSFWFITLGRLFQFDIKTEVFEEVHISEQIRDIAVVKGGIIWINTSSGNILRYSMEEKAIRSFGESINSDSYNIFSGLNDEHIWSRINNASLESEGWKAIPGYSKTTRIERFLEDAQSRLWIGNNQGLYYQSGSDELAKINFGEYSSILSNSIKKIFEDNTGGIWVGTLNGLFRLDVQRKPFKPYPGVVSTKMIMGIEESETGLWVNFFGESLNCYSESGELLKSIDLSAEYGGSANLIWAIKHIPESEFDLWLGTDAGLIFLNSKTGQSMKKFLEREDYIPSPVIFSITRADSGTVWITGAANAYLLSGMNGEVVKRVSFADGLNGPLVQDVVSIGDEVLFATEGSGILSYSEKYGVQDWFPDAPQNKLLKNNSVWDLYRDSDRIVWIGGNGGLFEFSEDNGLQKHELGKNQSSDIVFSIIEDAQGSLWLGTDKGLINYDKKDKLIKLYDLNDGLENPEFNRRSVRSLENGMMAVGGMNGVTYFNPEDINRNPNVPKIWATKFHVIEPDTSYDLSIERDKSVSLNWDQNTFEIEFSALNYTHAEENNYRYQLIGHEPGPVETNGSRKARYTRLPAGDYEFVVTGSNNDDVWNEKGDRFLIKVRPPYWQAAWFRILIIATLGGLIWAMYRFRVRQLLEMERLRLRIAGDLHDEIGSGLSGIALTGDLLQRHADSGSVKPELIQRITENARNLASSLDSIVWLIDPNKESFKELIHRCRMISEEMLEGKDLVIKEHLKEEHSELKLPAQMRRNLYLIFKESIHNILKHANATMVEITFSIERENLQLQISDNGIGFDGNQVKYGNGILNIRRRAEEINAHVSINSSVRNGTTIKLQTRIP